MKKQYIVVRFNELSELNFVVVSERYKYESMEAAEESISNYIAKGGKHLYTVLPLYSNN